jgi:hypothetical protein
MLVLYICPPLPSMQSKPRIHGAMPFYSSIRHQMLPMMSFSRSCHGTTAIPILAACATTLLANPSNPNPLSRDSCCFIFAISYTCFNVTLPTCPTPAFPDWLFTGPFPNCPSVLLCGPGTLPAPLTRFLTTLEPAAARRRDVVGGVRSSNVNERSGRTVTRAGIGVPET